MSKGPWCDENWQGKLECWERDLPPCHKGRHKLHVSCACGLFDDDVMCGLDSVEWYGDW
jgi:hypothetical protein